MSPIVRLIKALLPSFPSQHDRDEAYLAEGVDIYDLDHVNTFAGIRRTGVAFEEEGAYNGCLDVALRLPRTRGFGPCTDQMTAQSFP